MKNQTIVKNKISKLLIMLLSMTLSLITLSACEGEKKVNYEYSIFYTNANFTAIIEEEYTPKTTQTLELAKELFDAMKYIEIGGGVSIIPNGIEFERALLDGDVLSLYIKGDFAGLSSAKKLALCSGLTKSFAKMKDVSGLNILCNGSGITDSNGSKLGILRPSRFVNNAFNSADDYRESDVAIFYATEDGQGLIKCIEHVNYNSSVPLERVVVEKIIAGPTSSNVSATVPQTVTLLGINIRDKVCYVNFDDTFARDVLSGFDDIPVYSIVNSLTQLSDVDTVQITVNGKSDVIMPQGKISLAEPFAYNEGIVKK